MDEETHASDLNHRNVLSFPLEVVTSSLSIFDKDTVATKVKTIYIDGAPLYQLMGEAGSGLVSCLDSSAGFPTAAAFASFFTGVGAPATAEFNLGLMGLALASGVTGAFPLHKVPLLTCCTDPLCGYLACTVNISQDAVTWHSFGTVSPTWSESGFTQDDAWEFTDLDVAMKFTFDRTAYESAFSATLRARDQRLSRSAIAAAIPTEPAPETIPLDRTELRAALGRAKERNRIEARHYREEFGPDPLLIRFFGKLPGFAGWPANESSRLRDLIRVHDPLHLASHGRLSPQVYANTPWDTPRYSTLLRNPQQSLGNFFKKEYGVTPDPTRIAAIVQGFLAPVRHRD